MRMFKSGNGWIWTRVVLVNLPLTLLIILFVNDRSNSERRHTQAIFAKDHNALVCVVKPFIKGSKARSQFNAEHGTTPSARATARQAVKGADQFLAGLVTFPPDFNCGPLVKKLLAEEKARHPK